jgi:hypothetical protein
MLKEHINESKIELVNCSTNHTFDNNNIYLLFIPINPVKMNTPKKYIVYNFEQFTTDKIWEESYIIFLKKAMYVFDYSLMNIFKHHSKNINSYFLPYHIDKIYKHPELPKGEKDIDVLFIGNLNHRRKEWLKNLTDNNINFKIITNVFYENSIEYFARSKILLNIHFYSGESILEVTRIIPAIANNCIILSEISHDKYYNDIYSNLIKITSMDTFIVDINNILNNYNRLIIEYNNNIEKLYSLNKNDNSDLIKYINNII